MFTRGMVGKCMFDDGMDITIQLVDGKPMLNCDGEIVHAGECFKFEDMEGDR